MHFIGNKFQYGTQAAAHLIDVKFVDNHWMPLLCKKSHLDVFHVWNSRTLVKDHLFVCYITLHSSGRHVATRLIATPSVCHNVFPFYKETTFYLHSDFVQGSVDCSGCLSGCSRS